MTDKLKLLGEGRWPKGREKEAGKWVNSCFNVQRQADHRYVHRPTVVITTMNQLPQNKTIVGAFFFAGDVFGIVIKKYFGINLS